MTPHQEGTLHPGELPRPGELHHPDLYPLHPAALLDNHRCLHLRSNIQLDQSQHHTTILMTRGQPIPAPTQPVSFQSRRYPDRFLLRPIPVSTELSHAAPPTVNPMSQSWLLVSGFPTTPSSPRLPPDLAVPWLQRPPERFTSMLPPTHPAGQHSLLREDGPFRLYSQLLNEFTNYFKVTRPDTPIHIRQWGSILQPPMQPDPHQCSLL